MTHFLSDILRQPSELRNTIDFLRGPGRRPLDEAAAAIRGARHVYLTGIGSSWHAALTAEPIFSLGGLPLYLRDAAELLQFAQIPSGAVLIVISRSGRSVEIVNLLGKARESGATVIGLTNVKDGALAREAQIPLVVPAGLDHGISVNTYISLAATAAALATTVVGSFDDELVRSLLQSINGAERALPGWQQQLADAGWLMPRGVYYFLGRGAGLGSCSETRLLWEEGVKSPATSMGTGSFRHGPQEMVAKDMRFGLWIDGQRMREPDLAVARDLERLGASVMLIGHRLPESAANLVFQLPETPTDWQFLIDIIPAQLAAERLSRLSGEDCDSFKLCSYIVEDDSGLIGAPKNPS
jgi:glucosamine--fructose-6-phosphate aminotransferase (isomerizing)